jgi:hypothetical protein
VNIKHPLHTLHIALVVITDTTARAMDTATMIGTAPALAHAVILLLAQIVKRI